MSTRIGCSQQDWISVDNTGGKYIRLGLTKDFDFLESCSCSDKFDIIRNDQNKNVYFPVLSKEKLYIYQVSINKEVDNVTVLMQVILKDGTEKLSCYGSKLSDQGILWLCIFNLNMVIGCDLNTKKVIHEFVNIPAPNDLCLSKTDSNIIYCACGTAFGLTCSGRLHNHGVGGASADKNVINVPSYGQIVSIAIDSGGTVVEVVQTGVNALAGIESNKTDILYTQLYNMCDKPTALANPSGSTVPGEQVWSAPVLCVVCAPLFTFTVVA